MKRNLIIIHSYHHLNTAKIASAIGEGLDADVRQLSEINQAEINSFKLIGFGAGIDSGKHYGPMLEFAQNLPNTKEQKTFIFSTSAIINNNKIKKDHTALRNILEDKGYKVIGEFACKGYNTNSFLKFIGGMNRNHPNEEDLNNAKRFAATLK